MTHQRVNIRTRAFLIIAILATSRLDVAVAAEESIIAFDSYPANLIKTQDATTNAVFRSGHTTLDVSTGHTADWPGVTLPAGEQPWNLSAYSSIRVPLRNRGENRVTVNCRVDSGRGTNTKSITRHIELMPGDAKELSVPLTRILPPALAEKLYGMRGYPGGYAKEQGIDTADVTQLIIFMNKPNVDHAFSIGTIRAEGEAVGADWLAMTPTEFFPMIDTFGQFRHASWPGKVNGEAELKEDIVREQAWLANHPGPDEWDQYGGWRTGPQLEATGYFYPKLVRDKWWLVDPEGRLFWSHGVDCVGFSNGVTPITDREFYFADLPDQNSPLAQFYGSASWAPHGYYQDKGRYRAYNFTAANLLRKFGSDWREPATEMIHQRLRSWALNSIGNWSDSTVYLQHKTPYVVATGSSGAKPIEGSTGYWGKFPDPFDPSFREAVDRQLARQRGRAADDPWCIGFFVDNELAWGDQWSLAIAALSSPPEQVAKRVFIEDLQTKYDTIAKLNAAWGTDHVSWDALAECRTPPDKNRAADDLGAFYTRIAEEYFRHCRAAVKSVAPHNLYLGCRFAWVNDRGARAAAKYCDVIGYNLYRDSVAEFQLPEGVDMPVVIGEFHFGALDRGMFHTGLRPTDDQQARADAYRRYVTGALRNRHFVGSHWFQFGDQATTGRGDGENYQIGLVNICDRPYPETIDAVREIGNTMYQLRYEETE